MTPHSSRRQKRKSTRTAPSTWSGLNVSLGPAVASLSFGRAEGRLGCRVIGHLRMTRMPAGPFHPLFDPGDPSLGDDVPVFHHLVRQECPGLLELEPDRRSADFFES